MSAGTSSSAALFLSCTGRGLDTRLGRLLAALTEFILWKTVRGGSGPSLLLLLLLQLLGLWLLLLLLLILFIFCSLPAAGAGPWRDMFFFIGSLV